jgi:hypothetical protein
MTSALLAKYPTLDRQISRQKNSESGQSSAKPDGDACAISGYCRLLIDV